MEVFADGGLSVMTGNVFPDPEDGEVEFFCEGGESIFKDIEKFDIVV